MSEIDNGGPAFPVAVPNDFHFASEGMSLRDWLAGQALMSMLSAPDTIRDGTPALAAGLAYKFADAMIEARKVKP